MKPLLSICIPTCNRADFLQVMLSALLPQISQTGGDVEVWVLDNASDDNTREIVDSLARLGPMRYHRNERNIGPLLNIINGPLKFATGEYVWILGDHNLLRKDALERVLNVLRARTKFDVLYANFRCATYPAHWPTNALNGYDGPYHHQANDPSVDRDVSQWHELIQPKSACCTQIYAHIVRRKVWTSYWPGRSVGDPYSSAETTYAHTYMIAEVLWNAPSYYIGDPVLTIFDGAQSWGNIETLQKVNLRGFPDLLGVFNRQGWSRQDVKRSQQWAKQSLSKTLSKSFALSKGRHLSVFFNCLRRALIFPYLIPVVLRSYLGSEYCRICRIFTHAFGLLQKTYNYVLRDCRPARWLRGPRL